MEEKPMKALIAHNRKFKIFGAIAFLVISLATPLTATAEAPSGCFDTPGVYHCIDPLFLEFWWKSGGLSFHGYPVSRGGYTKAPLSDGKRHIVQYFERTRIEYHPDMLEPYQFQLGQFGIDVLPYSGASSMDQSPEQPNPYAYYFPTTGFNVSPYFYSKWSAFGGLARFGYPISRQFKQVLEDGRVYIVQYFERGRLEYHPENDPPYDILFGKFGLQVFLMNGGETSLCYDGPACYGD
jgi:hypothetical protein